MRCQNSERTVHVLSIFGMDSAFTVVLGMDSVHCQPLEWTVHHCQNLERTVHVLSVFGMDSACSLSLWNGQCMYCQPLE